MVMFYAAVMDSQVSSKSIWRIMHDAGRQMVVSMGGIRLHPRSSPFKLIRASVETPCVSAMMLHESSAWMAYVLPVAQVGLDGGAVVELRA